MDGHGSLEGVVQANVADLADGSFDETQPVPLESASPILHRVLDEARRGAQPVELRVEAIGWVVRDVVVKEGAARVVKRSAQSHLARSARALTSLPYLTCARDPRQ